jgi:hypothetical protein
VCRAAGIDVQHLHRCHHTAPCKRWVRREGRGAWGVLPCGAAQLCLAGEWFKLGPAAARGWALRGRARTYSGW